ncbi:MAG: uroporphyrinogen decarboxylase [Cytophagales bacterium]|nr:MAG: uroporphyrinogen decarboxylase [Cytophagales bacterium]
MNKIKNDLILRAAKGLKVERTPIWLMRQAGRILPEYRALREKFPDFKTYIKTPEAVVEATLQPIKALGVDAAIIFSDILVIPEAMGLNYEMVEKKGPYFPKKIETLADIEKLKIANPEETLSYVTKAISLTKNEINYEIPLIGFAGAPWTIFAYMTEGSGSKTFSNARKWLYCNPEYSHILLDKITQSTILYLKAQIKAGADMVQIFDSWAGILPPQQYFEFSLKYITQICDSITEVPITVFAKDAYFARAEMAKLNCQVVGLDWCMDIAESRKLIPNKTLQGNFDPCNLYASKEIIKKEAEKMLNSFGSNRYIANLGHGLYPDIDADKVKYFIEVVQNFNHDFVI